MKPRPSIPPVLSDLAALARQNVKKIVNSAGKHPAVQSSRHRDLDIEQAWLRIAIGSVAFGYACYLVISGGGFTRGLVASVIASGTAAVVGAWMVRRLRASKEHVLPLRYFAIFTDISAITIAMAGADEGGVPFIGFYLWVTVGNGFRFGPRFLLASYWLSMLGYAYLWFFVPFWVEHRAFSVGVLVMLGVVPLYVLVLLTRLTAQKDQAEQLSNAKSRFVANVSHELRTPLTGVSAVYDILRGRKMTSDDRELVGMLGNAIGTLKSSVDAVLMMSKLEAGAESVEARLFNLWYFVQQLAAIVRPQSVAKGLAWRLQIEEDVPAVVLGDQNHLAHALGNLLNNAFKFTTRGSITLRVSKSAQDQIRFEVTDTGIGIPSEQQERLFERFVQVDTSATRRHGGTGLGTSIARDLVELMEGKIGVVSAPGQGSTFWIDVPLPECRDGAVPGDWSPWTQVLLVGSDAARAEGLATSIRQVGLEPVQISNRSADTAAFDPQKYLAAILVMDASEAAAYSEAALRERAGVVCPWLVAATAYSRTQRSSLVQGGAAGLLPTPCSNESLCLMLSALRGRLAPPVAPVVQEVIATGVTRPLRILLADDNQSNQVLLSRILRDAGHSVTPARTGAEAFELMTGEGLDLALLDLNMPDMSGPDVVKLFRAGSVGATKLPIMILSADATSAAKRESLDAGADDFLTKPVAAATLLGAIDRMSAGVKARSEPPTTPVMSEQPIALPPMVDPERIQALRRIARGDQKFLDQYASAAFAELEQAISDLRVAVKVSDMRKARDALHIIEGTGASIGATALMSNCSALRTALEVPDDPDRAANLAELSTAYALTKSNVLAMLHETRIKAIGDRGTRM